MNPMLPIQHFVPDAEARQWRDGHLYLYGSYDISGRTSYCRAEVNCPVTRVAGVRAAYLVFRAFGDKFVFPNFGLFDLERFWFAAG